MGYLADTMDMNMQLMNQLLSCPKRGCPNE